MVASNPGTVQIILSLFIIFSSYIFKQSVEAMLILDFAHARYGCPEILAMLFREARECQMHEMVTSVKFAPETWCVNTGLTFNFRSLRSLGWLKVICIKIFWRISIATIAEIEPGSISAIVIAAIAGIAQIAEVWFPYNRWDRWANFSVILAISAIPAIIWKPGFRN